jgi:hypothetical protein
MTKKTIVARCHASFGFRRTHGSDLPTHVWFRIRGPMASEMVRRGVTFATVSDDPVVGTILVSMRGTFDADQPFAYKWQRKIDGALYIEVPLAQIGRRGQHMLEAKRQLGCKKLEAWLYRSGVVQVRA